MNKLLSLLFLASCATVCPQGQIKQNNNCIPQPVDANYCDHISASAYINCLHEYEPLQLTDRVRCLGLSDSIYNNCKEPNANSVYSNDATIR